MSQYASLNGLQMTACTLTVPYYGLPMADVTIAGTGAITGPCTLVIGNLTCTLAAYRQNAFAGVRSVRLVGGAGGWRKAVPGQAYASPVGVKLSTVLGDVARLVGETVNVPSSSDAVIGNAFVREAASAQRVLRQIVGALWWTDLTGVTQIVARPSGAITSAFLAPSYEPGKGKLTVSTEDPISWMPANTFTDANWPGPLTISASRFVLDAKGGSLRVEVLTTP